MVNKEDLNNILEKLKHGEIDYFDDLYDISKSPIYYTIISIIKDKSLAEDIMQDTYIKILNSVGSYKHGKNPLAWMITIARNQAINAYNRRKKEVLIGNEQFDYYSNSEYDQNTPLIDSMNDVLDSYQQQLITLHVINELSHKEIAKILKKPLGTILWQYNQAIKKFKKKVGDKDE